MSQTLLFTSITNYFDKKPDLKKCLSDIVNGKSVISLRVIDWFITHYTRSHNVIYWVDDQKNKLVETFPSSGGNHLRKVHLYLDYRAQLKSYTKLNFDPFRRHNRITFVINAFTTPPEILETTVGQLNFFRWAFQNHLVEYICNHLPEIETKMSSFIHERKTPTAPSPSSSSSLPSPSSRAPVVKPNDIAASDNKKGKRTKISRATKTNTDIIKAPCCLHFS